MIFLRIIRSLVIFYFLLGLALFVLQRDFLYFPKPETNHPYHTEEFLIANERIKVITLNKGKTKAIMYFGGNGEAVVNNAPKFLKMYQQHTVYLVNYRAYGGSTGTTNEKALYTDALYIYDKISTLHKQISVMGRSLGTGVATFLASSRDVAKLALITPYDSILHIAQDQYPIYPISLMLKDQYNSISYVKKIKSPALILLAEHDKVIPPKYSNPLINAFPASQVRVATIKNSGHNSISLKAEYNSLLKNFINQD